MKNIQKNYEKKLIVELDSLLPTYTYEYVRCHIKSGFFNSKEILEIKNRKQIIKLLVKLYCTGNSKVTRFGVQLSRIRLLNDPIFGYVAYKFNPDPTANYVCDVNLTDKGRALVALAELQLSTRDVMGMAEEDQHSSVLCF